MPTFLENLITSRDNLATELATESANPRPDYSVDGRSFPWSAYRRMLKEDIDDLQKQIFALEGDTEIRTIALS